MLNRLATIGELRQARKYFPTCTEFPHLHQAEPLQIQFPDADLIFDRSGTASDTRKIRFLIALSFLTWPLLKKKGQSGNGFSVYRLQFLIDQRLDPHPETGFEAALLDASGGILYTLGNTF